MLPRLLYRDWILHRRVILLSYGIFGAFQVYSVMRVGSPRAWLVFASIYAAFLSVTPFVREDKFQSTSWTCTLPVRRHEIVRARLLGSWILVLTALAGALLLAAVLPGSNVMLSGVFQPATLLLAATVVTVVVALMLPFTIRFGLLGLIIFLVAVQLLGAGLLVFGIFIRQRGGGAGRPIHLGLTELTTGLVTLRDALSPSLFNVLALALLIGLNWAGYRLAAFVFRRREL